MTIQNFKSIVDETIDLGRINVFIGENGCGKSNILEALAIASCELVGRADYEDYFNRGVRLAKPAQMRSAFRDLDPAFGDFVIFNLNVLALRGLDVTSRRAPLGIHGEGLDTLLASFDDADFSALSESARCVSWLDRLEVDRADARKYQGFKLGPSLSTLSSTTSRPHSTRSSAGIS